MNSFVVEIWEDSFQLVTYYTVRWDEAEESETDKFFRRFLAADAPHKESFNEILALLEDMGQRKSAKTIYFSRLVDEASELPPKQNIKVNGIEINYRGNSLRLFCTRINDHIVVLFNGGEKSSQATQDSPDLAAKFRDAKDFARKIWAEIHDGMIIVDEARHCLNPFDGSDSEIVIY